MLVYLHTLLINIIIFHLYLILLLAPSHIKWVPHRIRIPVFALILQRATIPAIPPWLWPLVALYLELLLLLLLLHEAIELALLEVAHKDLLLLSLRHLSKLPELILLEDPKGLEVGDPLLSDLVVVYVIVFVDTLRVEVLTPNDVYELVVLRFFVHSFFATSGFVGGSLKRAFKSL